MVRERYDLRAAADDRVPTGVRYSGVSAVIEDCDRAQFREDRERVRESGPAGDVPLVSIVVPVHAADPRHFEAAVKSLIAQSWPRLEILIVEARGITDDSRREVPGSRVRYFSFPGPPTQTGQYNFGLDHAAGEYVGRADADDVYETDRIARQVEFLVTHPEVDVVGTALVVIDDEDRLIGARDYPLDHDRIVAAMPFYNPIANPSILFRRRILDIARWEDRDGLVHARDYDWVSRLALAGAKFANLPDRLVRYRIHPAGVKTSKLRDSLRATLEVKKRYWSKQMPALGRIRMIGERLLLLLPPRLVLWCFVKLVYRARARSITSS